MRITNLRTIVKLYEKGSVSVCGQRGSGKDMLTANVIARRALPHVSNVKYDDTTIPFVYKDFDVGNDYNDLITGNITPYVYPYPDGTDIYLSDCGVYFPSQYNPLLDRDYKRFPTFLALSRHVGNCSVHTNSQDICRPWNKLREQSDCYLMAVWTKVLFGKLVIQKVRRYERYDACAARVRPCRIHKPLICLDQNRLLQIQMYRDNFYNQHGEVEDYYLVYINRSNYDTRFFKTLLAPKNAP